jgi:hypothetical protein
MNGELAPLLGLFGDLDPGDSASQGVSFPPFPTTSAELSSIFLSGGGVKDCANPEGKGCEKFGVVISRSVSRFEWDRVSRGFGESFATPLAGYFLEVLLLRGDILTFSAVTFRCRN